MSTPTITPPIAAIEIPRQRTSTSPRTEPEAAGIAVLGVRVAALSAAEASERIATYLEDVRPSRVVYVNASCLNIATQDAKYKGILVNSDLVLNDGIGLDIAARLQSRRFPANLNGTDFTPEILRIAAASQRRVFLLGGAPGVAQMAQSKLQAAIPGLNIVGSSHGYQRSERETKELLGRMRGLEVDVLIVGMGAPKQEVWLDDYLAESGARLGVAVGAFLDFTAGRVRRAPSWLRTAKLEWAFRLSLEPRRLFRRYVVGNPLFLYRVLTLSAESPSMRASEGQVSLELGRRHRRGPRCEYPAA